MSAYARLDGLDVARFLAFIGMVIVNFGVVMAAEGPLFDALAGKAAATFVILAGIGIGLSRIAPGDLMRRAAFLFVIGMVNALIFPADIIHFYAVYFVFAALVLRASARALFGMAGLIILAGAGFILLLDYDAGWDWQTLDYAGFWTVSGFLRNLIFNGWHPVFPWLAFLLVGMGVARMDLGRGAVQARLCGLGLGLALAAAAASRGVIGLSGDPEIALIAGLGPIPPMPIYMVMGIGSGLAVIGGVLWLSPRLAPVTALLAQPGRQSLTLYVAHIVLGMGAMEAMGLIGAGDGRQALIWAFGFCVIAAIYAHIWARIIGRGPLEALMRRLTGTGRKTGATG